MIAEVRNSTYSEKYHAITNCQLPITNYQLPITNYQLPIKEDFISGCPYKINLVRLLKH